MYDAARVLEVPPEASSGDVHKAFREKLRRFHPDFGCQPSARGFALVTTAFQILSRPELARTARAESQVEGFGIRSWEDSVADLRRATHESLRFVDAQRPVLRSRLRDLVRDQVMSYSSAGELRERAKDDVNAILQREIWSFIQRVGRRSDVVEEEFRAWLQEIRNTAYEAEMAHGFLEFLARPAGVLLTVAIFGTLGAAAGLAWYVERPVWLENGLVATAFAICLAGVTAAASICLGYALYRASWKEKLRHKAALLAAEVGLDSFQVGGVPIPEGLSSEERAGLAGAAAGAAGIGLTIWAGVEPITAAIAAAVAASWGWFTGKSFAKMRRDVVESVARSIEVRLYDFFDGFAHKLVKANQHRLLRMRDQYLSMLGPDEALEGREAVTLQIDVPADLGRGVRQKEGEKPVLKALRSLLFDHRETGVYVKSNIPEKKLGNALVSFVPDLKPSDVLVLYDGTVFGSAREGLCISRDMVFWRDEKGSGKVKIRDLSQISSSKGKSWLESPSLTLNCHEVSVSDADLAASLAAALEFLRGEGPATHDSEDNQVTSGC